MRFLALLLALATAAPAQASTSEGAPYLKGASDDTEIGNVSDRLKVNSDVVSSVLPTGAATAANQTTQITSLQLIDDTVHALNAAFNKATAIAGQLDDASTTAATEDNIAPMRITAQRALHVNTRNNAGTETGTSSTPYRIDPTGTTSQPVTQSTSPWVTSRNWTLSSGTDSIAAVESGTWAVRLQDGAGNAVTSQASSAQRALDVGIDVSGVQVDPRSIRALTSSDVVTANAGSGTFAVSAASLPLPTGAATSANQSTEITALQVIDDVPTALNGAFVKGAPVMGQLDDTSTTAATEDNVAPLRLTPQRALHTNLRNQAGTEVGTSSNRLYVDSAPAANTVSAANSTATPLGSGGVFTGTYTDTLGYADVVVVVKTDQASASGGFEIDWSSDGVNLDDSDTYTLGAGIGSQYSFGAMSQYFRVKYTNGAIAQSAFRLQTVLKRTRGKPSSHRIGSSITDENDAELVKAVITAKAPNGNYLNTNVDANGNLIVTQLSGFGANFTFGDVTLSATAQAVVNRTPYTEPTSAVAFSIKSSSANDTSAGTGARTVTITYMDASGNGPNTETVTLNGTTCVNSSTTTAKYFEKAQVITAGSGATNAGTITFYTGTGCSTTVGTISIGDKQTFWAHHYVPNGKTCLVTGLSVNHSGTTVGSGGVFLIAAQPIGVANAIEFQVGDFHRLYGQSSTIARSYISPIKVAGPARLNVYVTPETSSSTVYRASIDFFEQ